MLFMIDRQTEQKSEILKITGFALCAPFGRLFVEPMVVIKEFNSPWLIVYIFISVVFAICGFNCIVRSCDILDAKEWH